MSKIHDLAKQENSQEIYGAVGKGGVSNQSQQNYSDTDALKKKMRKSIFFTGWDMIPNEFFNIITKRKEKEIRMEKHWKV